MNKKMVLAALATMCIAACGGGGGAGDAQPTAKALTISMYGKPLVAAQTAATAHAQFSLISAAVADEAPGASDVQATIQTLQSALAARGVAANIAPQLMDGTALHQIVATQYNGKSPTPDQFKTDPSELMIVNFQLDDMATSSDDPAQQAAMQQFSADLLVFSQWAAVAGKPVYVVAPTPTCDMRDSAASGLLWAINNAFSNGAPLHIIGQVPVGFVFDSSGKPTATSSIGVEHFGADCRTPDSYVQNMLVDSVADEIVAIYKENNTAPASDAAAASAASAASGA